VPRTDERWLWCGWVGLLTAMDLGTKAWVFAQLGYEYRASAWQWEASCLWGEARLRFMTSLNRGAMLGWGRGSPWLLSLCAIGVLMGLAWAILTRRMIRGRGQVWGWGCAAIAAGSLGNLHDRLGWHGCVNDAGEPIYGVRDFIEVTVPFVESQGLWEWGLVREFSLPLFNLADLWLVLGVLAVCLGRKGHRSSGGESGEMSGGTAEGTMPETCG